MGNTGVNPAGTSAGPLQSWGAKAPEKRRQPRWSANSSALRTGPLPAATKSSGGPRALDWLAGVSCGEVHPGFSVCVLGDLEPRPSPLADSHASPLNTASTRLTAAQAPLLLSTSTSAEWR